MPQEAHPQPKSLTWEVSCSSTLCDKDHAINKKIRHMKTGAVMLTQLKLAVWERKAMLCMPTQGADRFVCPKS